MGLKLAVGYQLSEIGEESFIDLIEPYRDSIAELFFAWLGHPSGRAPIGLNNGTMDSDLRARFFRDLQKARAAGYHLDLLFNANCYGPEARSRTLERGVLDTLSQLDAVAGGADIITTTSPAIAWIVKHHRPTIETRASSNMRIGTIEGMAYWADCFDGFHVQRECNRDLMRLQELREWALHNGKRLFLLANSGCLRFCSGQTFHDNLVAHEGANGFFDALEGFMPFTCWRFLRRKENHTAVLQATWIRPEDLVYYEKLCDGVKLATRIHERPHTVVGAYARGRFRGNLLDLLEPSFSTLFAPYILSNDRFPIDWFEQTSHCNKKCYRCSYCRDLLPRLLINPLDSFSTKEP